MNTMEVDTLLDGRSHNKFNVHRWLRFAEKYNNSFVTVKGTNRTCDIYQTCMLNLLCDYERPEDNSIKMVKR